jgi:hypothetical protein
MDVVVRRIHLHQSSVPDTAVVALVVALSIAHILELH